MLITLAPKKFKIIFEISFQRDEARKAEQEFLKNWEETRQGRVNSRKSFITGKAPSSSSSSSSSTPTAASASAAAAAAAPVPAAAPVEKKKKKEKQRFSPMGFRPPKHKPESR